MLTGFTIGVYDGALGPGTGSFLVFALVGLLGYNFLEASAKAKIANFATNLGALTVFLPMGLVLFKVGVVIAGFNLLGGYAGARTPPSPAPPDAQAAPPAAAAGAPSQEANPPINSPGIGQAQVIISPPATPLRVGQGPYQTSRSRSRAPSGSPPSR